MKGGKPDEPEDKAALRLRDFQRARADNKKTEKVTPEPKKKGTDKNKDKDPKDQNC